MVAMKGLTHQWYTEAIQLAPHAAEKVLPVLRNSAKAAVSQCTGGKQSRQCGLKWSTGEYDGETGANQELSVLNAVFSHLVDGTKAPLTAENGGISKSGGSSKSNDKSGNKGEESVEKNGKDGKTPDSIGARASISMVVSVFAFSSALFVHGSW
jgi:mannan endo-1,6-alpha-mannosidase